MRIFGDDRGVRTGWWALLIAARASAERYVVQPGETVGHVAASHGCSTEYVERINHLNTSIVRPGTVIEVPSCGTAKRRRADPSERADHHGRDASDASDAGDAGDAHGVDDAKARRALAVIDGATWVSSRAATSPAKLADPRDPVTPAESVFGPPDLRAPPPESIGAPWRGALAHPAKLEAGDGFLVRRPSRAFGAKHVVDQLRAAIREVHALYPGVHTLAIGDLSAEHGGKISDHHSHQSGLDVDVGFYFTTIPAGYPSTFVDGGPTLDLEATWALLAAFARTASHDDGVQMIFLDYELQHRLYDFARRRGTPAEDLDFMFQYPRAPDELAGLVRHWPGHANHMHVRFKPAR